MQSVRRYVPALLCAVTVLLCELVAYPVANMGIADDWSYFHTAQQVVTTGHLIYSGWAPAFQAWQAYVGAAFLWLFGDSYTSARLSTLVTAMVLAFLLQRTFVRVGVRSRNATIGTLALVLSPLYLMISATFMTDIPCLFAIALCFYSCLRALQAPTSRGAMGWLCFAVASNTIVGSTRQIAWLGTLVMVPCTLWLLRSRRRVVFAGVAAVLVGALCIFLSLRWLQQQPYSVPENLFAKSYPLGPIVSQFLHTFFDLPFLLLPIMALFLPELRRSRPRNIVLVSVVFLGYVFRCVYPHPNAHPNFVLEPTQIDWVNIHGIYEYIALKGEPPIFLTIPVQILLTMVSIGGLFGLVSSLLHSIPIPPNVLPATDDAPSVSWRQLGLLLGPFSVAYAGLLLSRAATFIVYDRYVLPLVALSLCCLIRWYQERVSLEVPLVGILLVAVMAVYGVAATHNLFAFYRARVTLAAELRAAGIPDTSVDNGWEYNNVVELQHADHINDDRIKVPADAYAPVPSPAPGDCPFLWSEKAPHVHARYGVSFTPNACYGLAPFAPVHYSRWLASAPGTLYIVRYTSPPKQ